MPIYVHACSCGHEQEDYLSITAPAPEHCGQSMTKVPQLAGMAFVTKSGNWYRRTAATGPVWQGGGRPKPKVVGKGHGVGSRRPPPSIRKMLAESGKAAEIAKLATGKTA